MASENRPVGAGPRPAAGIARWTRSSPGLFRMLSVVVVVAIAGAGVAFVLAANALNNSSQRVENNTGPVLVATQGLFASIAEADAAASAVFLSGANEDRAQRNLYEDALARSTEQIEEIARLVGDDAEVHESLKTISRQIVSYAGQVEQARLANLSGDPAADAQLQAAIATVRTGMVPEVENITLRSQAQLSDDIDGGRTEFFIAIAVAVIALGVVVVAHSMLASRTRRIINAPLVLAGIILFVALGWLVRNYSLQQSELDAAVEQGSDAIALSAQIQSTAFQLKTDETVGVVEGQPFDVESRTMLAGVAVDEQVLANVRDGLVSAEQGLLFDAARSADGDREQAAIAGLLERWQRYRDVNEQVEALLRAESTTDARSLSVGVGNDTFNGFNAAVEGVLLDNRQQFIDGAAAASDRVGLLPIAMLALPFFAAIAAMLGFQMRINDYR